MNSLPMCNSESDRGRMANNYILVQSLRTALSRTESNANVIPKQVIRIISEDAWREWIDPSGDGEIILGQGRGKEADFRQFIQAPWPNGCGTPTHVLERMIRGTPAWEAYLNATRGEPGGLQHENRDESGQFTHNRYIVTDVEPPSTIPLPADAPRPKRARDYARESQQGNCTSYTLRRLEKHPDLLEKVNSGELTPNAAAVEAGFRVREISIPPDPMKASRRILRHFHGDALITLASELANHAGYDLVPKE